MLHQILGSLFVKWHDVPILDTAAHGNFTLAPSPAMRDALGKDYTAMSGMIFGEIPSLDSVLASIERFEQIVNGSAGA